MNFERFETKNTARSAISSGSPNSPRSMQSRRISATAGGMIEFTSSVEIGPGAVALQRMPRSPYIVATERVSTFSAAFDALYAVVSISPRNAFPAEMFAITPPEPVSIAGMAYYRKTLHREH